MASIQYSDVTDVVPLPVDAQDVVTKVILVISGNRAGDDPASEAVSQSSTSIDYAPLPITYEYEAPEHSTYGVERAFDLPQSVSPFLDQTDELIPEPTVGSQITNPGDPSAVRDGDPDTYASGGADFITYTLSKGSDAALLFAGWKLRYGMVSDADARGLSAVVQQHLYTDADAALQLTTYRKYALADTNAITQLANKYGITPGDARSVAVNSGDVTLGYSIQLQLQLVASARVSEFYPLLLDEAKLLDIAKSNVKLPASEPKRVTVRGYVAPDREHTIVGWPGGDFTGVVAQHQYELGRTVIDFEQAGAPTGLSAVSMQEARRQQVAVDRALQKALYPVRMGERQ